PGEQGKGYGARLIGHLLRYFEAPGVRMVTLNTQEDIIRWQRLHRRLGFVSTGHRAPVWTVGVVRPSRTPGQRPSEVGWGSAATKRRGYLCAGHRVGAGLKPATTCSSGSHGGEG